VDSGRGNSRILRGDPRRLGVPFAHQNELDDKLAELAAINASLAATTADADPVAEAA
jgi:hypothetical protein